VSHSHHLNTETHPVSETLYFLVIYNFGWWTKSINSIILLTYLVRTSTYISIVELECGSLRCFKISMKLDRVDLYTAILYSYICILSHIVITLFLFPSLCGLSMFKTLYSVLITCHFLTFSKSLHVSALIGHPQVSCVPVPRCFLACLWLWKFILQVNMFAVSVMIRFLSSCTGQCETYGVRVYRSSTAVS
jgi:hypothetical protein